MSWQLPVQLDCLHQNCVGMIEILKLPMNLVQPFFTVKKIVPKTIDDDQHRRRNLGTLRRFVHQNSTHKVIVVAFGQIEMAKMIGEFAVAIIPVPKIRELWLKRIRVEQTGIGPPVSNGNKGIGVSVPVQRLRLEQTPQEREM